VLPLQGLVGLSVAQGFVCATAEKAGLKSGDIITEYDVIVEVDKKAIKSVERSQHKGALGAPEGGVAPSDGTPLDIIAHSQTLAGPGAPRSRMPQPAQEPPETRCHGLAFPA
jgi:hypothetical protein